MKVQDEPEFVLKASGTNDDYTGYLCLPNHPPETKAFKTVRLQDLHRYTGEPDIYIDFDENDRVIGIEFA